MLKIRLQRVGRKNIPTFRVVLTDSRNSTKSGRFLEVLGVYDPVNNVKDIKADRIKHWMSKGVQVSETVHNFLVDKKLVDGKKINVLPRKSPIKAEVNPADVKGAENTASDVPEASATEAKEEAKPEEKTPVVAEAKAQ